MEEVSLIHKELIIERSHQRRCVPVLGAAANVSSPSRSYQGLPLAADVAKKLAEKMGLHSGDIADLDLDLDLAKLALEFESEYCRAFLVEFLKTIIPDKEREPSLLLKTLAKLPLKLIITTNYDRLMERALEEANRTFKVIVPPREGWNDSSAAELRNEIETYDGLVLFKIHGSFNIDEGVEDTHLVITEDDYIDFMGMLNDGGIPKSITRMLVDSMLLFLGYSLKDWDFRLILRGLPFHQGRTEFMVLKEDPSKFWIKYLKRKGIIVQNIDIYDFAEQIDTLYSAKYS